MVKPVKLTEVFRKIARANKHIADFEIERDRFLATDPYPVATKRDPQSRKLVYYVASVKSVPEDLPLIAGDAIQNLRTALDYLACELVRHAGHTVTTQTSFPISKSSANYGTESPRKVEGMSQDAIDAINSLAPYKGGNNLLWILHALNIRDKHRLLFAVGSAFLHVDVGPRFEQTLRNLVGSDPQWKGLDNLQFSPVLLQPSDRLFPLKAGDELFIDSPDAEVNEKMNFGLDIAISEPGVVEGEPLLALLQQIASLSTIMMANFKEF